jgi:hypothetical protein
LRAELIDRIDRRYGVFEHGVFKSGRFASWLGARDIPWPRTPSGQLALDKVTFRDQARLYPELEDLRQLRHALSELRLERLAVGSDGRNRTMLSPFGASSSRNTPSANRFVFGPSAWIRSLIQPPEGRCVVHIDWHCQELAVVAVLSGDEALLAAVSSGDPYLSFAIRSGFAPPDATKASHRAIRDLAKTVLLGTNYGLGARSLAARTGITDIEAYELLRRLRLAYPTFSAWIEASVENAQLAGWTASVFGWPFRVTGFTRPTTLRNFPAQSNGAEMLRLACIFATEEGVAVDAPIHDALLVESEADQLDETIEAAQAAMAKASRLVLDGFEVATEVSVTKWPDRFSDPRGEPMWRTVTALLDHQGCEGFAGFQGFRVSGC